MIIEQGSRLDEFSISDVNGNTGNAKGIVLLDPLTGQAWGELVTIDSQQQKIHTGRLFSGGAYNAAVSNSATLDILLLTSATLATHGIATVTASAECTFQIFESPTYSAVGSAVTMSNHNRMSAKVFDGNAYSGPTITAATTQLNGTIYVSGGGGGNAFGASLIGFDNEYVFQPNSAYLFRVTNISGQASKISLILELYQPNL